MTGQRIAFVAYRGSMKSGGLGIYLHALTRELVRRGFEIDLFVGPPYPDPMPWVRMFQIPNAHYWDRRFTSSWRAPLPHDNAFSALAPLNFFEFCATRFGFLPEPFAFSLRAARAVIGELRRGVRYRLVHDVQTLGYGLLWLRALGLPCVSTVHHPLTIDRRFSLRRDRTFTERKGTLTFYPVRTQARVARRIDALVTSSQASVRELCHGFGVPLQQIHDVGNGVELPDPGERRRAPNPPELLFLGRGSDPNKGLEHLLAALTRLPERVSLRVLDGPPGVQDRIRGQLTGHRLDARVRFDGKVPRAELEQALRRTSIVVVPSLFEGFGLPAVEALACGTPVVASRAGALPEVIGRAGTGTLVPPGDPAALAAGIQDTLQHWDVLHEAALKARGQIEAEFGWTQVAARTVDIYTGVLEQRMPSWRTPRS